MAHRQRQAAIGAGGRGRRGRAAASNQAQTSSTPPQSGSEENEKTPVDEEMLDEDAKQQSSSATATTSSLVEEDNVDDKTEGETEEATGESENNATTGAAPAVGVNASSSETELSKEELIARAKKIYNKERKIIIKNVPPVTYEEVKEFIGGHSICNIVISKKSRHAVVTLMNGEDAEEIVDQLTGKHLLGTDVTVALHPSDKMLCLTNLPPGCQEKEIHGLLLTYGAMEKFFLMRCEDTGESKNYAVFEYCHNKEKSGQIREELNWKEYKGHVLQCDFIEENLVVSYDKLNSRCLLVNGLPKDFKDHSELKVMFSNHHIPIYCQIVLKDNVCQECAIVEYATAEEAESTWRNLREASIKGNKMEISFSVPGLSAVLVYNKIIQRKEKKATPFQVGPALNSSKSGLLPDPVFPNPSMMNNPLVKGLANQNPKLLQQFQQALQLLQKTYIHQTIVRNAKPVCYIPGLLGPGPNVSLNPLMNPNMQLGLIILLALQMQGQRQQLFTGPLAKQLNMLTALGQQSNFQAALKGQKPSLLGDPMTAQANLLVQNLMSQMNNEASEETNRPKPDVNPLLTSLKDNMAAAAAAAAAAAMPKPIKFPFNPPSLSDLQKIQNLNIQQLMALGQLMSTMQNSSSSLQNLPTAAGGGAAPGLTPGAAASIGEATKGLLGNPPQTGPLAAGGGGGQQQKASLWGSGSWGTGASSSGSNLGTPPQIGVNVAGKPGLLPSPNPGTPGNNSMASGFNQNVAAAANFMRNLQVLAAAQQLASGGGGGNAGGSTGSSTGNNNNSTGGGVGSATMSHTSNNQALTSNKRKNTSFGSSSLLGSPPRSNQNNTSMTPTPLRSSGLSSSFSGSSNNNTSSSNSSNFGYNDPLSKRLSGGSSSSSSFFSQDKRSGLLPQPLSSQTSSSSLSRFYDRLSTSSSTSRGHTLGSSLSGSSSYSRSGLYTGGYSSQKYQSSSSGGTSSGSGLLGGGSSGSGGGGSVGTGLASGGTSGYSEYSSDSYNQQYGNSNSDQYYDSYNNYYDNQSSYQSNYSDQDGRGGSGSGGTYYASSKNLSSGDYSFNSNKGDISGSYSGGYNDNYYGNSSSGSGGGGGGSGTGQYESSYTSSYTSNYNSGSSNYGNYGKGSSTANDSSYSNYQSNYNSNYGSSSFGSIGSSLGSSNNFGSSSSYSSYYGNSGSSSYNSSSSLTSPIGQKRSYSQLLPPPEASPEGGYIGQHSQGIGGHYADSYAKRKRYDLSVSSKGSGLY